MKSMKTRFQPFFLNQFLITTYLPLPCESWMWAQQCLGTQTMHSPWWQVRRQSLDNTLNWTQLQIYQLNRTCKLVSIFVPAVFWIMVALHDRLALCLYSNSLGNWCMPIVAGRCGGCCQEQSSGRFEANAATCLKTDFVAWDICHFLWTVTK